MLAHIDARNKKKSTEVAKEVLGEYQKTNMIEKSGGKTKVLATKIISSRFPSN